MKPLAQSGSHDHTRPDGFNHDEWFFHPGYRAWALLHLDQVLPGKTLSRGRGPVAELHTIEAPSNLSDLRFTADIENSPIAGQVLSVADAFDWLEMRALIVLKNNRVVVETYKGMHPDQRHHWMSISKATINMLMGMLVSQGELDLNKSIGDYVSTLNRTDYGQFRIQDVANMDVGVSMNEEDYSNPNAEFRKWARAAGWLPENGRFPDGLKGLLRDIQRRERDTGPDRKAHYTGSSSQAVAWVIEEITGLPIVDAIETFIWSRLGAEQDAFASVDAHGVMFVGGGMVSSLRDLARFGSIWTRKGLLPNGERLFSEQWTNECTDGSGPMVAGHWRYHNQGYSRGTELIHQGHSGQMLWANPATDTQVCCFGASMLPNGSNAQTMQVQIQMAEAIDRALR